MLILPYFALVQNAAYPFTFFMNSVAIGLWASRKVFSVLRGQGFNPNTIAGSFLEVVDGSMVSKPGTDNSGCHRSDFSVVLR
jgi:hypothetical protein